MSRRGMFKRGAWWWGRIPRRLGPAVQRALGTNDAAVALRIVGMLRELRGARAWPVLDAIVEGRTTAGRAYDHFTRGTMPALLAELADAPLEPFIPEWVRWMERRGTPNARGRQRYEGHVRGFVTAGATRGGFHRAALSAFLSALDVDQPNRYHASLSSFARFLVERGILDANPLREVARAKERPPRIVWLDTRVAALLLAELPESVQRAHDLMAATGMEVSAVRQVRRRDLDVAAWTCEAVGTKTRHRVRTVRVRDVYGVRARLAAWAATALPDARVTSVSEKGLVAALRDAGAFAGAPAGLRSHDWRHTFAVQALRDGWRLHDVAHQLGHANTIMAQRVYGRFEARALDLPEGTETPHGAQQRTISRPAKGA